MKPGQPINFNKEKSIGLFVFYYDEIEKMRNCKEIARAKISAKGDVYVFPHPQFQSDYPIHESFHTSKDGKPAKFHWTGRDFHQEVPAYGERDLPAPMKFAHFRAANPPCFCLRKGKGLNDDEVKILAEKLLRFTPDVEIEGVIDALRKQNVCQLRQKVFR